MENERESSIGPVRRRRLLRAGGAAVAGAVGAGVVGAVVATPAQAAPGDPVTIGSANAGGTSSTSLTSSNQPAGTLVLGNTHSATDEFGDKYSGAPLVLTPHTDQTVVYVDGPIGSLGATPRGHLYTRDEFGPTLLRTRNNSMEVIATAPQRLLDTRDPAYRTNILNPSALDPSAGYKLRAVAALHLNLAQYLNFADALFATITVVGADRYGYLVAYPYNTPQPNASSVNYNPAEAISCLALVKIGFDANVANAISLVSSRPVHVIVDAVGANAPSEDNLVSLSRLSARNTEVAAPNRSFKR
jgi:hypothetical protein